MRRSARDVIRPGFLTARRPYANCCLRKAGYKRVCKKVVVTVHYPVELISSASASQLLLGMWDWWWHHCKVPHPGRWHLHRMLESGAACLHAGIQLLLMTTTLLPVYSVFYSAATKTSISTYGWSNKYSRKRAPSMSWVLYAIDHVL